MINHSIQYNDGNSVALDFNEGKHQYTVDGEYVPAVTSVLGTTIAKQKFLMPWAVKMGAQWFEENIRQATRDSVKEDHYTFKDNLTIDEMVTGIKKAYRQKSEGAIELGKRVHQWCEDAILWKLGKGEVPAMPDDEASCNSINAFRNWVKQNDVEWIAAEKPLYHRKYKYAGTVDAIANVNGEFSVIDFKTSNRIYDEYHLQVAAYGKCVEDIYGKPVDGAYILRFDKQTGAFDSMKSNDVDVDFITFCGLLVGYNGLTKLKMRGSG
jgi:hypothetical protein